jgi:mxaJ protein
MFSACLKFMLVLLISGCAAQAEQPTQRVLRVCADPNNMPFSNDKLQGFENRIAEVLADEMNAELEYTWWAQRRGFIRNTLKACSCDVVIGIPSSIELAATTNPYYRSTFTFVTLRERALDINSFDDVRLKKLQIGVHVVGDDGASTPPAQALARRGMIANLHGYSIYGDYSLASPPSQIFDALRSREIDVAIVWGPLAGYAATEDEELQVLPVDREIEQPFLPFAYDISMGVRREDTTLLTDLDSILERRKPTIDSLLTAYGVIMSSYVMAASR